MVYFTFILSLWSSMLSAAGMVGQAVFGRRAAIVPPEGVSGITAHPYAMPLIAIAFFYLPIFISCYLVLRHIKKTGKAEPLIFAALALNTFSLLYGLILYGALAR